jgi:hypothetical protein
MYLVWTTAGEFSIKIICEATRISRVTYSLRLWKTADSLKTPSQQTNTLNRDQATLKYDAIYLDVSVCNLMMTDSDTKA